MIKGILKSSPLLVMAFMIIMTSVVRAATEYEIRSLCPDSRVVVEIENENRGLTSQNLWVFACNSLELNAAKKIN